MKKLGQKKIRVSAKGNYPDKAGTPVADVHRYQNDGTATITPAHYVEKAVSMSNGWSAEINKMIFLHLFFDIPLVAPLQIETDISAACDRVKTRRLKTSFESTIVND